MGKSYKVEAVLSAKDDGFTKGFKEAIDLSGNFADKVKSGLSMGIFMGIGTKALDAVTSGISGMIGEMNQSSATWKTFTGNMKAFGKSDEYIADVREELQSFAEDTIYSSSDMATTFAQLEAVGTKNTTALVKGFGGLASAAEDPQQAMKTLSTQATQMAAKPYVAWQDFKLMLEQTPAGIAKVAEAMGKTTEELISDVQDGTVATQDFFDAVTEAGNSDAIQSMARQYKNVSQALDGLQETAANKLMPVFSELEGVGIKAIEGIAGAIEKINFDRVVSSLSNFFAKAKPYWDVLKEAAGRVVPAFGEAFKAVSNSLAELTGKFGSTESIEGFKSIVDEVADALVKFAGFIKDNSEIIAKFIQHLPKLAAGFAALKVVQTVAPAVQNFAGGILRLAQSGIGKLTDKLPSFASGAKQVGTATTQSSTGVLQSAVAFLALGGALLLAAGGFWILSQAAVQLASAGPGAIAVMLGLVGAIAALAYGASLIGQQLTAGAVGMVAFGAALLLVGAGLYLVAQAAVTLSKGGWGAVGCLVALAAVLAGMVLLVSALGPTLITGAAGFLLFGAALVLVGVAALLGALALTMVADVLPQLCEYGLQGAAAIGALSIALIAFGAGAAVAGIGVLVLGAAMIVLAVGLLAAGAAAVILGAGMILVGAGALLAALALMAISLVLPTIAEYGLQAAAGITAMGAALIVMAAGGTLAAVAAMLLAVGMGLLGIALLLVSVGALGAAVGLSGVASALSACVSGAAMGAPLISLLAIGMGLLSAASLLAAVGIGAVGAAGLIAAIGVGAFAAAVILAAAGMGGLLIVLMGISTQLNNIQHTATETGQKLSEMVAAVGIVEAGLQALGSIVDGVMGDIISIFARTASDITGPAQQIGQNAANGISQTLQVAITETGIITQQILICLQELQSPASTAGQLTGQAYVQALSPHLQKALDNTMKMAQKMLDILQKVINPVRSAAEQTGQAYYLGLEPYLKQAIKAAQIAADRIPSAFASAEGKAYNAGQMIGQGLANGMQAALGYVQSVAAQLAAAADQAIRAKARISSPSKEQIENGLDWGRGLAIGIDKSSNQVRSSARNLIDVPTLSPDMSSNRRDVLPDQRHKRPVEVVLRIGNRALRGIASDITDLQDAELELQEVYSV